jgi:hypothetical protein
MPLNPVIRSKCAIIALQSYSRLKPAKDVILISKIRYMGFVTTHHVTYVSMCMHKLVSNGTSPGG